MNSSEFLCHQNLHKAVGTLRCTRNWLVVDVDDNIAQYYRALLPKYLRYNIPLYPAHITVIRDVPELGFEPRLINFEYSGEIQIGEKYIWLPAYSEDLTKIRLSLGLEALAWYNKPPNNVRYFHITIGNFK